ncbi:XRE family transcriptional regulator [Myxococcota bacterium]|nr:XRE family transcriptional regulator [Myxococcota bacterium]MBU1897761.1 XRE family transcriptional regulator [Myxococcota bacterium]
MFGERIKRARQAAGLSQQALAQRVELSAMAISKFENDAITPTSTNLIRLAKALNTRVEFFLRPTRVALTHIEYRKQSSLRQRDLARIEADLLEQAERFFELLSFFPERPIPSFSVPDGLPARVDSLDDLENFALKVREAWHLGTQAIPDLTEVLESQGLFVFSTPIDEKSRFDGLTATINGAPIIALAQHPPGDRQRFTMAHELGHLLLDGRLAEGVDLEKACDRFAGALLVPASTVRAALGRARRRIEPYELLPLKQEHGLSMMSWVFRAHDVGVIPTATKDILFKLFRKQGWHLQEPGLALAREPHRLFERLVFRALAEDLISMGKAAELMQISTSALRSSLALKGLSFEEQNEGVDQ